MSGNARRLFMERKAYAFRGDLAPTITDKDLEHMDTRIKKKKDQSASRNGRENFFPRKN
jgi:hypothetical protein